MIEAEDNHPENATDPAEKAGASRISVAMCTYNGSRFLQEQLDSIAGQRHLPCEVVVCDDGSTDQTPLLVSEFARRAPFMVRLIRNQERLGSTRNFEKAIALCEGDWIALCDQDDIWLPEKLEVLSATLRAAPALGGAFSDGWIIDERSRPGRGRLWERFGYRPHGPRTPGAEEPMLETLLRRDVVTGATLLFRASLRELMLPIPEDWVHDAWITWMIVLYSGLAAVAQPLIEYRVHAAQQLGAGPASLTDRMDLAKKTGRGQCASAALRFEEVRSRWTERPGKDFEGRRREIEGKIRHLRDRANLPDNFLTRLYRITAMMPDYRKYSNGPVTMLKDLLVP